MTDIKRRQNIKKKSKRRISYCQSAHKVVRQDGKQVVDDQTRETAEEKRMEDGMRRFLNRKQ